MKVFTCTSFTGHWPVGTAAVIVAEDNINARRLLMKELNKAGLGQEIELEDIKEVSLGLPAAIILRDGIY